MLTFYETGFEPDLFCQKRMISAQKGEKLIFIPNNLVGSQALNLMQKFDQLKYFLSYGHFGISKSFNYYQHFKIGNMQVRQLLKLKDKYKIQQKAQEVYRKFGLRIKKHFYWNMELKDKITQQDAMELFKNQMPELPK